MKDKTKRIIITVVALVALINGLKAYNRKMEEESEDLNISYTNLDVIDEFGLYDANMDYISVINDYLDNNKDLSNIEYVKAVYMLLYNSNVEMNNYLDELNTMLICNQNPTCVSMEEWEETFSNLIKVSKTKGLTMEASYELGRLVLPLAAYIHSMNCEYCNGSFNPDIEIYNCSSLNNKYTSLSLRK